MINKFFKANTNTDIQNMLLMSSFANPDMQEWLPFILQSDKSMTDKLIMMSFLKKQEEAGLSSMNEILPLMMMDDLLSEVGKKLWQIIMKTMSNIWMQLAVKVKLLHI